MKQAGVNGVTFVGNDSGDSGVNGYEIKFDGKDDYLRLDNKAIERTGGLTLEFYGNIYGGTALPIERTRSLVDNKNGAGTFRWFVNCDGIGGCLGTRDYRTGEPYQAGKTEHWFTLQLRNKEENISDEIWMAVTIDFRNRESYRI